MRILGLAGMASGPGTPGQHPGHKVYPHLLRSVAIVRPNHVWSTDTTYIRLARGFADLVAIIDWYSRRVLTWRINSSMDATYCVYWRHHLPKNSFLAFSGIMIHCLSLLRPRMDSSDTTSILTQAATVSKVVSTKKVTGTNFAD
jgi:hypothetical protein